MEQWKRCPTIDARLLRACLLGEFVYSFFFHKERREIYNKSKISARLCGKTISLLSRPLDTVTKQNKENMRLPAQACSAPYLQCRQAGAAGVEYGYARFGGINKHICTEKEGKCKFKRASLYIARKQKQEQATAWRSLRAHDAFQAITTIRIWKTKPSNAHLVSSSKTVLKGMLGAEGCKLRTWFGLDCRQSALEPPCWLLAPPPREQSRGGLKWAAETPSSRVFFSPVPPFSDAEKKSVGLLE